MEDVIHYPHRHAERNKTVDNTTTKSLSRNNVCNVQRANILFLAEFKEIDQVDIKIFDGKLKMRGLNLTKS